MVVETLSGLMVGAVAERLAGHGSIVAPFFGQQCHKITMQYFNLKKNETDIIKDVSIIPLLQEQVSDLFVDLFFYKFYTICLLS